MIGVLILATIYLQLIKKEIRILKRYFPFIYSPALCTIRCLCENRRLPFAALSVLTIRKARQYPPYLMKLSYYDFNLIPKMIEPFPQMSILVILFRTVSEIIQEIR